MKPLVHINKPEGYLPVSYIITAGLLVLFIFLLSASILFHSPFGIVSTDLIFTYLSLSISIISLLICPSNVVLNLYSFFFHLLFTQNLLFFFIYPNFDVHLPDYIGDFQITSGGIRETTLTLMLINLSLSFLWIKVDKKIRHYHAKGLQSDLLKSNSFLSRTIILLTLTSFLSLGWGILTVKTKVINVTPGGNAAAIFFNMVIVNYLSFKPLLLIFFSSLISRSYQKLSRQNLFLMISSFSFLAIGRMYFGSKSGLAIFIFYFLIVYLATTTRVFKTKKKLLSIITIVPLFYLSYAGGEIFREWKATPEEDKLEFLLNHSYAKGSISTVISRISSRASVFHYFYIISSHKSPLAQKVSLKESSTTFLSQLSNINIYRQLPSSLIFRSYIYPNYNYDKNFQSYQTDWYSLPGEIYLYTRNRYLTVLFVFLVFAVLTKYFLKFTPPSSLSMPFFLFLIFNILGSFGINDSLPFLLKFSTSLFFYLILLDISLKATSREST